MEIDVNCWRWILDHRNIDERDDSKAVEEARTEICMKQQFSRKLRGNWKFVLTFRLRKHRLDSLFHLCVFSSFTWNPLHAERSFFPRMSSIYIHISRVNFSSRTATNRSFHIFRSFVFWSLPFGSISFHYGYFAARIRPDLLVSRGIVINLVGFSSLFDQCQAK